jgi:hypothetical protein
MSDELNMGIDIGEMTLTGESRNSSRKTCPSATFHINGTGTESGHRGEKRVIMAPTRIQEQNQYKIMNIELDRKRMRIDYLYNYRKSNYFPIFLQHCAKLLTPSSLYSTFYRKRTLFDLRKILWIST